ncbi:hypothetical protein AYI70_g609 [Smittium culicis]|uniref:PB1 domain-containing protein n=1 Tax=Smittium culicis TaxID=133412 RepID=A0A1R1YG56_9FUNG|nr:hypothetical protein AYI70_g609 [Smittium culicis]
MPPVIIKFIYKGPEYYRYYWENYEKIKWKSLIDGVRLLFGITSDKVTLVYKDLESENILITNQFDLDFILSNPARDVPYLKVLVIVGTVPQLTSASTLLKSDKKASELEPTAKMPTPAPISSPPLPSKTTKAHHMNMPAPTEVPISPSIQSQINHNNHLLIHEHSANIANSSSGKPGTPVPGPSSTVAPGSPSTAAPSKHTHNRIKSQSVSNPASDTIFPLLAPDSSANLNSNKRFPLPKESANDAT